MTTDLTPFDHSDNAVPASTDRGLLALLHRLAGVLDMLDQRLRPASGFMNVRPLGGTNLSLFNITVGTEPVQVLGDQPHGMFQSAFVRCSGAGGLWLTTQKGNTSTANAYFLGNNTGLNVNGISDLYAFDPTGGRPVLHVALSTFDQRQL